MVPIYLAIARAGFYVFIHAQVSLVVVLALSVLIFWWLKPWRMRATAAAVVITPLLAIYMILALAVVVPVLQAFELSQVSYNPWFNLVPMFLLLVFLPAGFYYLLERLDRDRDRTPNNPLAQKILDYIGMVFFLGFVLVMGFGNFFKPIASGSFNWHTLVLIFISIAGLTLLLRLIMNSIYLVATADNFYLKELKRYYPALLYIFLGSTALALVFYGLDTIY